MECIEACPGIEAQAVCSDELSTPVPASRALVCSVNMWNTSWEHDQDSTMLFVMALASRVCYRRNLVVWSLLLASHKVVLCGARREKSGGAPALAARQQWEEGV